MSAFPTQFSYAELIGFLTVGGLLIIGAIAVMGAYWIELRKSELLAGMKQSMLERGMSAEEISDIMNAGTRFASKKATGRLPVA